MKFLKKLLARESGTRTTARDSGLRVSKSTCNRGGAIFFPRGGEQLSKIVNFYQGILSKMYCTNIFSKKVSVFWIWTPGFFSVEAKKISKIVHFY